MVPNDQKHCIDVMAVADKATITISVSNEACKAAWGMTLTQLKKTNEIKSFLKEITLFVRTFCSRHISHCNEVCLSKSLFFLT